MLALLKKNFLALLFVFGAVLLIQTVKINRPYRGHFASYQATVMASISRNMMRENFSDVLMPKTDFLIQGQRSLHLNQYPFPSLIAAGGAKFLGGSLEFWGRFQAVLFNLLTVFLVGLIASRAFNPFAGAIAAVLYALSPFSLIYGQSFISEPLSVFFLLLSLALIQRGQRQSGFGAVLASGVCLSLAVTGRIHFALFYPVWIVALWKQSGLNKTARFLLFSTAAVILPCLWYGHTWFAGRQSDHLHTSLFLQLAAGSGGQGISFANLEFIKHLFDVLSQTMLTPLVFPFLILGLCFCNQRNLDQQSILLSLFPGILTALLFPSKVMAQDFYLSGLFPFLIILAAFGLSRALEAFPELMKKSTAFFFITLYLLVSARYFLHPIFKVPAEEQGIEKAASFTKARTQPEDKLIVAAQNPALLLYYADRPAWPLELGSIGKSLRPYQKVQGLRRTDLTEIQKEEEAMRSPVSWLEYLKAQGAAYLLVESHEDLEKYPDFQAHVLKNYKKISPDHAGFYLFSLKSS